MSSVGANRRERAHTVLIVDEGWNQTLALARSLEHAGFAVTVLTADGGRASYLRRTVQWSSVPLIASAEFLSHLDRWMSTPFAHVLPLTEDAMWRLADACPAWAARIFPRIDDRQRALLRDKHILIEHLAARDFSVPRHHRLTTAVDLDAVVYDLGLPLVVKGATGAAGSRVRIAESRAAFATAVSRSRELGGDWIAQEYIPGPTCLVGGLFLDGEPLRLYAAEKLEQHPPRTGPAIRLRSDDHAALLDAGMRVFRELRWTGFASADLIRDVDGRHVVLEVNPRLWGSIAGASAAGVDLFAPFAELLAGRIPAPDLSFATDRDCRIFPQYLRAPHYRGARGAVHAVRDLLGDQGRELRHPGFVRYLLGRLYRMRRQARPF